MGLGFGLGLELGFRLGSGLGLPDRSHLGAAAMRALYATSLFVRS